MYHNFANTLGEAVNENKKQISLQEMYPAGTVGMGQSHPESEQEKEHALDICGTPLLKMRPKRV